jgi:hypothetical protein
VFRLEMKSNLSCDRPRCHVVRTAECGQKIVKHVVVRHIDHREASAPCESITVKQVIVADREVKKISRSDASGVVVVVLRIRRRHLYERGSELRGWACTGYAVEATSDSVGAPSMPVNEPGQLLLGFTP